MMLLRANVIAKGLLGRARRADRFARGDAQRRALSGGAGAGERRSERRSRASRPPRAHPYRRRRAPARRQRRRRGRHAPERGARSGRAAAERRDHADQRHAGAHGGCRRRAARHRSGSGALRTSAGAMSLEGLLGTPDAFDERIHARADRWASSAPRRCCACSSPTARFASRIATAIRACRTRMRSAACRRCTAPCSTRSLFAESLVGARAQRRDGQSARLRRRHAHERRQLPRPGGRARARRARDCDDESRDDRRAAHRPARASGLQSGDAAVPEPRSRSELGVHDGAGHGRIAGERMQGAVAPGERRHDPDRRQQGRRRADGDGRGVEAATRS